MNKTIHMASAVSRDADHVIPLCADFPRFVEPGASWTHRPREVTCAKCRGRGVIDHALFERGDK